MTFVPCFAPLAFCVLMGLIQDKSDVKVIAICGAFMILGAMFGGLILFKTTKTQPPEWLLTISSITCFVMSIAWIAFTSDLIVDLLGLFGKITDLNQALLNLTVLAWGNCLGDMSADVAMTKKGFGEMAITATVAGPIFNVMVGGFLANFGFLLSSGEEVTFTAFEEDGSFSDLAVLPTVIICAQLVVLVIMLFNALINKFKISFKLSLVSVCVYISSITFLCWWCISQGVKVDS